MHHALVRTAALFRPCLLALALAATPCAAGELEAMQGAPAAPRLELEGLDGQLHSLTSHRGQVVLVNFWGTWCPPCVAEMPSLQRLQSQLSDERFTLLTVNYGENAHRVAHFRDQRGLDIQVLLDPDLAAADAWGDNVERQPDITRAREILGWAPKVVLQDGLARTLDYFRSRVRV